VYDADSSVTVFDTVPEGDQAPDYDPPA
jgi:hypothetical protein